MSRRRDRDGNYVLDENIPVPEDSGCPMRRRLIGALRSRAMNLGFGSHGHPELTSFDAAENALLSLIDYLRTDGSPMRKFVGITDIRYRLDQCVERLDAIGDRRGATVIADELLRLVPIERINVRDLSRSTGFGEIIWAFFVRRQFASVRQILFLPENSDQT